MRYATLHQVQRYRLRTGDEIMGVVAKNSRPGKSPPLAHLHRVNDREPEEHSEHDVANENVADLTFWTRQVAVREP